MRRPPPRGRRARRRRGRSRPAATASNEPPERPATWGTPHAAASRKTIPKPSCSSPPHLERHGWAKTSARPSSATLSASLTRPRNRTSARATRRGAAQARASRPSPAIASVTPSTVAPAARDRLDEHVDALARHEPPDRDHERRRRSGSPSRARAARARVGIEGDEALGVDARRHAARPAGGRRRRGDAPRPRGTRRRSRRPPRRRSTARASAAHERAAARGSRPRRRGAPRRRERRVAPGRCAERDVGVVEHEVGRGRARRPRRWHGAREASARRASRPPTRVDVASPLERSAAS